MKDYSRSLCCTIRYKR